MSRRNDLHPSEEQGRFATEWVANEYGLDVDTESAEWYDAVHPNTGTKYEVKSTHATLDNGATGRFRLWEDQHVSLVAADRSGTAWYAFVLLDESGEVRDVRRARPSTVTSIINDVGDGEWNMASHSERESQQQKVPWPEVMG